MKICTKCDVEKALVEFSRDAQGVAGRQSWCKECQSAHNAKPGNRKRRLAQAKMYRELPGALEATRVRCRTYRQTSKGRAVALFITAKGRSKKLNVAFDLDRGWIEKRIVAGHCEVTGLPFKLSRGKGQQALSPSLDRIKAGGGYTKKNCRVVCWAVNAAFGNWGLAQFLPVARALVEKNT